MQDKNLNSFTEIYSYLKSITDFEKEIEQKLDNTQLITFTNSCNNNSKLFEIIFNDLDYINKNWHVESNKPIFSHRRIIGKIIVFGKKLVRKFLRWYVDPIAKDISSYNVANTNATLRIVHYLDENIAQIYKEINNLKNLFNNLSSKESHNDILDIWKQFKDEYLMSLDKTNDSLQNIVEKLNEIELMQKLLIEKDRFRQEQYEFINDRISNLSKKIDKIEMKSNYLKDML
jgi:O-antigen chain-terminating methyltransferase